MYAIWYFIKPKSISINIRFIIFMTPTFNWLSYLELLFPRTRVFAWLNFGRLIQFKITHQKACVALHFACLTFCGYTLWIPRRLYVALLWWGVRGLSVKVREGFQTMIYISCVNNLPDTNSDWTLKTNISFTRLMLHNTPNSLF